MPKNTTHWPQQGLTLTASSNITKSELNIVALIAVLNFPHLNLPPAPPNRSAEEVILGGKFLLIFSY